MFTLDSQRKITERKKIVFSHDGFRPIENNGYGIFIVRETATGLHWMSVPVPKKGLVRLYPMMEINNGCVA